jgi:predicted GIY-YIG superfamily endonuclease
MSEKDGKWYTGYAVDLRKRLAQHQARVGVNALLYRVGILARADADAVGWL